MHCRAASAWLVLAICLALAVVGNAVASTRELAPEVVEFIDELATTEHYNRAQLRHWFAQARVQNGILRAIARPTTALPWYAFRATHVTEARIKRGMEYWRQYARVLARASLDYGVPEEIIVATVGIESFYGRLAGTSKVFDALYTLAFHYPPRAELFRSELKEFLLLARELRFEPLQSKGSYAGALGVPQFLPSSYRRYAVDFDQDGRRDLWNHDDAIGSIANYYKSHGWQTGAPVLVAIEQQDVGPGDDFKQLLERGIKPHTTVAVIRRAGATPAQPVADDTPAAVFSAQTDAGPRYWMGFNNFYVVTRYNRSVNYALAVLEMAHELRRARDIGRLE